MGVGVVQMGRGLWGVARRGGLSPTKEMEIWRLAAFSSQGEAGEQIVELRQFGSVLLPGQRCLLMGIT